MVYGGPHAAYFATRDAYKRHMPGRLVGVSKDTMGRPGLRLALQTREQHIRREKATSNICTAQVLLAVMASMFAVYHGPDGLRDIARRVHRLTAVLVEGLEQLGIAVLADAFFDTIRIHLPADQRERVSKRAEQARMNLLLADDHTLGVTLDQAASTEDLEKLLRLFAENDQLPFDLAELAATVGEHLPLSLLRQSPFLTHPVFNRYHSETEMLRYIRRLESRDLSLTTR